MSGKMIFEASINFAEIQLWLLQFIPSLPCGAILESLLEWTQVFETTEIGGHQKLHT